MTLAERNAKAVADRRNAEAADAIHFLVYGPDEHKCIHDEPCGLTYDPMPYFGAEPQPSAWYAGTGIGALYGLPGSERFLPQLAEWTVWRHVPLTESEADYAD